MLVVQAIGQPHEPLIRPVIARLVAADEQDSVSSGPFAQTAGGVGRLEVAEIIGTATANGHDVIDMDGVAGGWMGERTAADPTGSALRINKLGQISPESWVAHTDRCGLGSALTLLPSAERPVPLGQQDQERRARRQRHAWTHAQASREQQPGDTEPDCDEWHAQVDKPRDTAGTPGY